MNERRYGFDPEYIGALPGGPVPVPEEAVRRILDDPEGFAKAVSDRLRVLLQEQSQTNIDT